ncbi:hypothetical protein ILUMI_16396 [Ignelater luminosus]|uniref:GIY-YIG domain-containing protein n=1 Tax=Ignelater luminosus TaxID=2038154 RepID=A0A8K0CT22_IGNLU|nr:hypothetical protein ILUMI_16396 [Ignelater luminosus]
MLTCNDCNAVYIGETGRSIETRVKEHIRNNTISNFGRHLSENQHTYNKENTKLLHQYNKGYKLLLLEALEIEKIKKNNKYHCLNDQQQLNFTPIFQQILNSNHNK